MSSTVRPQTEPKISVAVCAHNAARFLPDVIRSLMSQTLPPEKYEVLLVNNASTDDSGAVIEKLSQEYGGRLRRIIEPRRGLSTARNRALADASAPLVAFIDADAVADENWLEVVLATFDAHPRAGVVGGRIEVLWEEDVPAWWDARLDEAMGKFSPSDEHLTLAYPQYPYGGNFAVRTAAIREVGGFEADLGRNGAKLLAGEEGELCWRMQQSNWEIHYDPGAIIHHRALADRLTRRYILRRAFNHGRSQNMLEGRHGFESGLYLSRTGLLWNLLTSAARLNWNMPYFKFIFFRMGYQYQRTISKRPRLRRTCPRVAESLS